MIAATQRRVIWIDVSLQKRGKQAEMKTLVLWREFLQWQLDTNVFPVAKGPQGPLGWAGGYTPGKAKKVIAWLKARGVEVEAQRGAR